MRIWTGLPVAWLLAAATSVGTSATPPFYDVRSYGAAGDGRTLAAASIQKAVDVCGAEEARRKVSGYTLPRPNLIRITGCKRLTVTGVTLQNSPKFHLVPEDCEDVLIENVTILAPEGAANTDAIDPTMCQRVTITKCLINVGDDKVAIKSGKKMPGHEFACDDLTITDCIFKHGHGLSIGSETAGGGAQSRRQALQL